MALSQDKQFGIATAFFGVLSFVFAIVAELKKGTPVRGRDVVICQFPPDPTVALGVLSVVAAACCAVVGAVAVFFPYKGRHVPRKAFFDYTPSTSSSISPCITVAGTGMTVWTTATEASHRLRNVHRDPAYACPTAKTGVFGGAAFLNLDASLFWLVCLILANNVREDYFDAGAVAVADRATGLDDK
ncbi:hypothetical protein GUJ93_ZPchr0010g8574 [Zizania palustris]|uniref:Uncharacterized protein n=1 Tax=Zizania palustris TaxID=103762 RepID=A0A8J5WAY3_ZIZPA|nr:hypothetical protein GUJ93_ZPchr0010g8574 [Zizania palustris]